MSERRKIAVFGLGSMGMGMARSLLAAGHQVHGFDLNAEAAKRFETFGGAPAVADKMAGDLDIVVSVVLNGAQTRSVLFGEAGIAPRLKPGAVIISCATLAPEVARQLEKEAHSLNLHYLDAPISGGAVKAAEGALTIMASGSPEAFAAAKPALDATAQKVFQLGDAAGAGSAMKAINQLLAGVHIAAAAEAVTFGMTQGVSPDQTLEVISQCAGSSWMFENRVPHIAEADYSPRSTVNIWPKDLGIVLDIAKEARFSAPLAAAAMQQFLAAAVSGLGDEDDAAVAKVYARNAGVTLPQKP